MEGGASWDRLPTEISSKVLYEVLRDIPAGDAQSHLSKTINNLAAIFQQQLAHPLAQLAREIGLAQQRLNDAIALALEVRDASADLVVAKVTVAATERRISTAKEILPFTNRIEKLNKCEANASVIDKELDCCGKVIGEALKLDLLKR